MSRPLRIEYDNAWYHIYNRGSGRRKIFLDNNDYNLFFELLAEILDIWNVQTHAFSLMANHYHLAIHTPNGQISRAMRHLSGVYTQRFNRRHKTDGPLFKGRFKSRIVENENYLLELIRYIHLNPVKAGICDAPAEHRWTSHKIYTSAGKSNELSWLFTDEVLSYFGRRRNKAISKFDLFVKERIGKKDDIISLEKYPVILGSDGFKEWIKTNFINDLDSIAEIPEVKVVTQRTANYDNIMKCVMNYYQLDSKEITKAYSGKKNEAKSMTIYLLRQLTGASHNEIAKFMGGIKASTVAKAIQRFSFKIRSDEYLSKLCEALAHNILSDVKT